MGQFSQERGIYCNNLILSLIDVTWASPCGTNFYVCARQEEKENFGTK